MINSSITNFEAIGSVEQAFQIKTVRSADGTIDLRYGVYRQAGETQQYVVFLNGRSEYIEKYAYVAADLGLPPRTAFLTWDHRGQGASGGARAYVDDYATYSRDARQIINEVCGNKPYVIVAHSMGSLVALHGTLNGMLAPKAQVLSSPLFGLPNQPLPRQISRPAAKLLTMCGLGAVSSGAGGFEKAKFENNILTHNCELYKRIIDSPYKIPSATFGWVTASFDAIDLCFSPTWIAKLTAPTMVLAAGEEEVVDPDSARHWVREAIKHTKAEVQIMMFPGAKHELFSEMLPFYTDALKAVRTWLKPYVSGW